MLSFKIVKDAMGLENKDYFEHAHVCDIKENYLTLQGSYLRPKLRAQFFKTRVMPLRNSLRR